MIADFHSDSKEPAKVGMIAAVQAAAWDSWIWLSLDYTAIFFAPPEASDADFASRLGLALATAPEDMICINKGHDLEAS